MPICYLPCGSQTTRISWYGGESMQLHYEVLRDGEWIPVDNGCRTLIEGMPSGVKELSQKMVEFYNDMS